MHISLRSVSNTRTSDRPNSQSAETLKKTAIFFNCSASGIDVQPGQAVSYGATPDLVGLSGVHIECKRNERLNVPEAMAQAVRDADRFRDGAPAVFHRRNRSGWLVTMQICDWMEMYQKAQKIDT